MGNFVLLNLLLKQVIMKKYDTITLVREQFPALTQQVNGKPLVYLDNAATSQKPNSVIELSNDLTAFTNGNIHRAVHELSARTTVLYEGARDKVAEFINARRREEIIFTSGTTASLNLVAFSLSQKLLTNGDSVLVSGAEHHSNIVPWQMACERNGSKLKVLPVDDNGMWQMDKLETLLDEGVKIVSVAHISNVLGIINPVKELILAAHKRGIIVVVDGAQGIVHSKVDVQDLDCDFYVFSGHKMYATTGTGVLYGKYSLLEEIPPWMGGGDMVDSVSFEKTTYAAPPLKFEAGTPNFGGIPTLGAAVDFISGIDPNVLLENENQIIEFIENEFKTITGLKLYGNSAHRIPLFSFNVEGIHPTDIAMLMDKMGVALRSGQMCSEPVMNRFNAIAMVRASFAAYNNIEDAEVFVKSLKRAVAMLA